jgi:hypothetical protein
MRDAAASHVQKYTNHAHHEQLEPEWRRAFIVEREGAAQSFCLSVRSRDGRDMEGFAMSLYIRHKWIDRGAKLERLMLVFSAGGIYVEGQHLQRGLDALEEGKLKCIQAQDGNEIAMIKSHNADMRRQQEKEPIVSRVVVSPRFDDVLDSEDNLLEIAKAMKEDYAHNGGNDKEPAR